MDQPQADDIRWRTAFDARVAKADGAVPSPLHAGEGAVERGFAGAVGAEHRDDFAGSDGKIDPAQNLRRAIARVEAADGEKGLRHSRLPPSSAPPRPCRDRLRSLGDSLR